MTYSVSRDDGELYAAFAGDLLLRELLAAMEEFGRLDETLATTHSILDFTEVTSVDLTVDEMHRFASRVRVLFPRTREHRFAVVAPSEATQVLVRDYVEVRNMLAIRPPEGPNEVAVFVALDPARRWASRIDDQPDGGRLA